jgi:pyridinium-3,5-bisthiocarboxylic acid mononucleotide nickel chelatase
MEKPGLLVLLQADHLSGEEIGYLVERLLAWGGHVTQILQTQTKKQRPAQLLLVDLEPEKERELARGLAQEFGISGYQRIETVHCHAPTHCQRRPVRVHCGQRTLEQDLTVKLIGSVEAPLLVRAEHESLVDLCAGIRQRLGVEVSLPRLRRYLQTRMISGEPLELCLQASGEW